MLPKGQWPVVDCALTYLLGTLM